MTLIHRQAKSLQIARLATSLQVAVVGESNRSPTQLALDAVRIAEDVQTLAGELKDELRAAGASPADVPFNYVEQETKPSARGSGRTTDPI